MLWSILASWITVGIVVPLLIGIGVGVMSMNPPDFAVAKAAFSLAALILVARATWWIGAELPDRTPHAALFAFVIFGGIGAIWISSLAWVGQRKLTLAPMLTPPVLNSHTPSLTKEDLNEVKTDLENALKKAQGRSHDISSEPPRIEVSLDCTYYFLPMRIPAGSSRDILFLNRAANTAGNPEIPMSLGNIPNHHSDTDKIWPEHLPPNDIPVLICDVINHGHSNLVRVSVPVQITYLTDPRTQCFRDVSIGPLDSGKEITFCVVNSCPVHTVLTLTSTAKAQMAGEDIYRPLKLAVKWATPARPNVSASFNFKAEKVNLWGMACE